MKQLPKSPDTEKAIISAWLDSPDIVAGHCIASGLSDSWFTDEFCAGMYRALSALWLAGKPCGYATLSEHMRRAGEWDEVADRRYYEVAEFSCIPSAAPMFIETLKEKATLRALIAGMGRIEKQAWTSTDAPGLLAEAMQVVTETAQMGITKKAQTFQEQVNEYREQLATEEDDENVIKTGIRKLDELSPMRRGDMPIIAGDRKSGKSILSLNIALHIAETMPVLYFSLEDKTKKLMRRIVANASRVPAKDHRAPDFGQDMQLTSGFERLNRLKLTIHDDLFDLAKIIGAIRHAKATTPDLAAVFLDYGQLIRGTRQKGDTRETEVASTSRALRLLSMETNTAIVVLSQLNADGATRESKGLENDATAMWKLSLIDGEPGTRSLEIPFQRDGESGVGFRVAFIGETANVETLHEH